MLDFLTRGILECESLGDAFRNLAITVLEAIQRMYAEALVKNLMGALFGGGGGASAGGGDASGFYQSQYGMDYFGGGGMNYFAEGGEVHGPGTETSDSIFARLSRGEFVINAESVRKIGTNFLHRVNSGDIYNLSIPVPKFATGGYVGNAGAAAAGQGMAAFSQNIGTNVSTKANVNVTVVRNEADALAQTLGTREGANVMVNWVKGSGTLLSRLFDLSKRGR